MISLHYDYRIRLQDYRKPDEVIGTEGVGLEGSGRWV